MKITQLKRTFMYEGRELGDVDPALSVDDVIRVHAATIPELATAVAEGPVVKHGQSIYTLKTKLGTKG